MTLRETVLQLRHYARGKIADDPPCAEDPEQGGDDSLVPLAVRTTVRGAAVKKLPTGVIQTAQVLSGCASVSEPYFKMGVLYPVRRLLFLADGSPVALLGVFCAQRLSLHCLKTYSPLVAQSGDFIMEKRVSGSA